MCCYTFPIPIFVSAYLQLHIHFTLEPLVENGSASYVHITCSILVRIWVAFVRIWLLFDFVFFSHSWAAKKPVLPRETFACVAAMGERKYRWASVQCTRQKNGKNETSGKNEYARVDSSVCLLVSPYCSIGTHTQQLTAASASFVYFSLFFFLFVSCVHFSRSL